MYRFQAKAQLNLNNSVAGRIFHHAIRAIRPAYGAPVALAKIAYFVTGVAIVCIAIALIYVTVTAVRVQWRADKSRLLAPIGLLCASAVFFILAAISYHAFQQIPPGEPAALESLRLLLEGNLRFWSAVALPISASLSLIFAIIGGPKLIRRVEYSPRLHRVETSLAVGAAACLSIVLASTIASVATLTVEAPDFLTSKDGGPFGTSFLPVFLVATMFMIVTSWIVASRSNRCVRIIRTF
jgi:hypothetical protein